MATYYIPDVVIDECIDALGTFVELFLRGGAAVRGQENRVALPSPPSAVLTELFTRQLGRPIVNTPNSALDVDQTTSIQGPTQIEIQIDFYGKIAGDVCEACRNAFNSTWAWDQFPANIKPLTLTEGIQAPLVTGEQQYADRWTATASMQYNPVTTMPQQSALTVSISSIEAEF